jgi:hypothetical protein
MAGEYKVRNGLQLDFTPAASGGTDTYLTRNVTTGLVTTTSTIPVADVSGGGNVTEATSSVLTITGGTGAVLTSGLTIQVKLAGAAQSGYLSTTDWNTFNNKLGTSLTDGQIWIGSGAGVATGRTLSGDVTVSNTGVTAIGTGVIVDADISNSASIAVSKLAALSINLVVGTNGSGVLTPITGFTSTIAGYLTNITSDVQAQFTTTNQRIVGLATNAVVKTPTAVQTGYAIIWDNTANEWTLGPVGGGGSVTGPGSSTDTAIVRWNGTGGTSLSDSAVLIDGSNNMTGVTSITVGTAGLHLLDTNASHDLIVVVGSNLTADRNLTVTTGDADRTITLSGNPTLSDWFDQSVKTTGTPLFADVTVSNASGLHILDSDDSHDLILRTTSNLTADRELIFVTGDATRTLTINASGTLYVTGGTDVSVADGGTGLSAIAALSILVANSANTYVALTPGAGNSIRMNAGGTAWEAYTPGSSTTITVGTTAIASGTSTRIPFNDGGVYAEDSAFTWDKTNDALTVGVARMFSIGTENIFIGELSGNFTTTGTRNTAIGYATLDDVTSGGSNTAVGYQALRNAVTTNTGNTAVGASALSTNAGSVIGDYNTAIGFDAGGSNTMSGSGNVFVGRSTGNDLTTGSNNIFIGHIAGEGLTTGSNCVYIGANIDAQSATVSGQMSIQNAIFGSGNTSTGTTIASGNIGFFATTWGTSAARVISIGNGTAPSTSIVDGIQLYAEDVAASSELKVRDEAGNVTTLSPHNFSLIGEPSEDLAWAYYSERDGKKINVDMLKLARLVEKLSGDKLVYTK